MDYFCYLASSFTVGLVFQTNSERLKLTPSLYIRGIWDVEWEYSSSTSLWESLQAALEERGMKYTLTVVE